MEDCVQWNLIYGWKDSRRKRRSDQETHLLISYNSPLREIILLSHSAAAKDHIWW